MKKNLLKIPYTMICLVCALSLAGCGAKPVESALSPMASSQASLPSETETETETKTKIETEPELATEAVPEPDTRLDSSMETDAPLAPESQNRGAVETSCPSEMPPIGTVAPTTAPDLEPGYVQFVDSVYGLILEVPEEYQDGIACNRREGVAFSLYEPTSYEALYIESHGTGGGLIWEVSVYTVDEFCKTFEQDSTEWVTMLEGPAFYMMGRTEEYVYVVRYPTDVQSSEETSAAYSEYKSAGFSILKRFLARNEIEMNPEWETMFAEKTAVSAYEYLREKALAAEGAANTSEDAIDAFIEWFATQPDLTEEYGSDDWEWFYLNWPDGSIALKCNGPEHCSQCFIYQNNEVTWGPTGVTTD